MIFMSVKKLSELIGCWFPGECSEGGNTLRINEFVLCNTPHHKVCTLSARIDGRLTIS